MAQYRTQTVFVCQYVCNPNEKSPELSMNSGLFVPHIYERRNSMRTGATP